MKASVEKKYISFIYIKKNSPYIHYEATFSRRTIPSHRILFLHKFFPTHSSNRQVLRQKSVNLTSRFLHDAIDERQIIFFFLNTYTHSLETHKKIHSTLTFFTIHLPFPIHFHRLTSFFLRKNLSQKIIFTPSIPRAYQKNSPSFFHLTHPKHPEKFIPHSPTLFFNTLRYIPLLPRSTSTMKSHFCPVFFYLFFTEKTCSRQLSFFPNHDHAHASNVRSHSLPSQILRRKKQVKRGNFFFYRW